MTDESSEETLNDILEKMPYSQLLFRRKIVNILLYTICFLGSLSSFGVFYLLFLTEEAHYILVLFPLALSYFCIKFLEPTLEYRKAIAHFLWLKQQEIKMAKLALDLFSAISKASDKIKEVQSKNSDSNNSDK